MLLPPYRKFVAIASAAALLVGLGCSSSPPPQEETEPAQTQRSQPVFEEPAEEPEPEEPTEEQRQEAERVSDQDLEMFAAGVRALAERERELQEAGRDYETRRRGARGPVEVRQIEEETIAEMEDAVQEGAGVEFEAFMKMGMVIQQNPILLERLSDFLDDEEIEDFFG